MIGVKTKNGYKAILILELDNIIKRLERGYLDKEDISLIIKILKERIEQDNKPE